jgi:hypothetical protein
VLTSAAIPLRVQVKPKPKRSAPKTEAKHAKDENHIVPLGDYHNSADNDGGVPMSINVTGYGQDEIGCDFIRIKRIAPDTFAITAECVVADGKPYISHERWQVLGHNGEVFLTMNTKFGVSHWKRTKSESSRHE